MGVRKVLFLIKDDEILLREDDGMVHKRWANSLGISREDFNYTVRGSIVQDEGYWSALFYYNYDKNDGRCAAAARKFAPQIMKYCKTDRLEIWSDEEMFIITKNDIRKTDAL